jgi:Ca-activated chloride channel family protein
VSFREPLLLAGLALVPLVIAAYVAAQRRRRQFAVRYTNVDLLAAVAPSRWTRHLPALFALLALAALLIAIARPERTVAAQRREANVMLVTDTSGSMLAKDVKPDRLNAARGAALKFLDTVPDDFRVGLVKFGSTAEQMVEPTTDRSRMRVALRGLSVAGATAMGDGLSLGLDAARTPVPDGLGNNRRLPAAIVLLSDGASTRGADPIDIAQRAKKAGVRIYTVALGTAAGVLETQQPDGTTKTEKVPPDTLTLREIARTSGGEFYSAPDATKLEAVYKGLATKFSTRQEKQEVTAAFAGGGLVLLLGGLALSMLRGGRLP